MKKKLILLTLPLLILASCETTLFPGGNGFGPGGGGNKGSATKQYNPGSKQGASQAGQSQAGQSQAGSQTENKGQKISVSKARSLADTINTYMYNHPTTNARVTTYDFDESTPQSIVEFDDSKYAGFSWSIDDYGDGFFIYNTNSIGYYYFEYEDAYDSMRPDIHKWYVRYNNLDLNEEMPVDYFSRYNLLVSAAKGYCDMSIDTSDFDSTDENTTFYSSGSGHLRIETTMASYVFFTEYRNNRFYRGSNIFSGEITVEYDISVRKPAQTSSYELYGVN